MSLIKTMISLTLLTSYVFSDTCIDEDTLKDVQCNVSVDNISQIMDDKGWDFGSNLMEHWFEGTHDNYIVDFQDLRDMDTTFDDIVTEIETKAANNTLITENMQLQIIKELAKNFDDLKSNEGASFDHISTEMSLLGTGWKDLESEMKKAHYFNEIRIGDSTSLNAWTASIGEGTLRFVASGHINKDMVLIKKVGLYLRDSYDFIGFQYLGCWSYDEPYAGRTTFSLTDARCVTNKDFRRFASVKENDIDYGNFRVLSEILTLDTYQSFPVEGRTINRAEGLSKILNKLNIPKTHNGFNNYIFGEKITAPTDLYEHSIYKSTVATAYNRGIVINQGTKFYPSEKVLMKDFIKMLVRAIPIPLDNPNYDSSPYSVEAEYKQYIDAAYNAGILESYYLIDGEVKESIADVILDKAYTYALGKKSGINIYTKWSQKYTDIDLYMFNPYSDSSVSLEYDDNNYITNMNDIKNSTGIVYWSKHLTNWGAALDYDSWGGNGNQQWSGTGEERITVDVQQVQRPGTYNLLACYFDNWSATESSMKSSAEIEWWGYYAGNNINKSGSNYFTSIDKGKCRYIGTLNTK
ncbi:MAG: Sporulation-specific N-acetylmuramoyl-L-alanine amidase [uncultured Sulfurovum sp.]|uniref:Sporulation-specific N-acetylmuramoyl-L-alanine amidase n=1 Tax=uncultured Sulfurovum sp. TaxID=269237 RepID=A0A6S6SW37_9BACT|nr:MAG: Sporulation-specific N-acetylmuramoyl-L-alanine amidase [uncultured Sulfurovum sp.]